MSPSQIIVLATPVFFLLIAIEFAWGWARKRNTYRLNDAINSISLGMLSETTKIFTRLLRVGIYGAFYTSLSLVPIDQAREFWTSWYGWLLALLFYDFCYYWNHRGGHEVAVLWAAHAVHHQSQDYNLSTALRQTGTGALFSWIFYIPMAVAGVPPLVFGIVALVDLLYQFWVHTEQVGKLGWFDRWFCSPSNHRVHHAVNDRYLDRNYGGILIIWDRLFGSFEEESEKCVYGTRSPLNSWDPLWANAEVYWALAKDSWHARSWREKLLIWLKPPGYRPAELAARFPKPPFDISKVEVFHPPVSRAVAWFGGIQFLVLLQFVALFLWHADRMPLAQSLVWLSALTVSLWAVGAVMQGRLSIPEVLLAQSAALAMATGTEGLVELHRIFKPVTMLLAIACVAQRLHVGTSPSRFAVLLVAGLAFSLAGDCFLMFPGYFIPGLVAFLIAHIFYIALFKQGMQWFPSRRALVITLGFGAAMYAFLFNGLNPTLKVAVAAYVLVIALMAAQSIGRATVLRDRGAIAVAVGAGFFMASDALLATNKFAFPLPMAQFWVLATYYIAQLLIACNASPAVAPQGREPSAAAQAVDVPAIDPEAPLGAGS